MLTDRFGYPVRVIEPPHYLLRDPARVHDRCADRQKFPWSIYRDPTAVPVES
jgi:hypothetical protein